MGTPVTREDVMRFERAVLKRLFNARLVDNAIADVAEQMGWPQLEDLANGAPAQPSSIAEEKKGGKKRKKDGSEREGKPRAPHSLSPYTLFVSLAMDMIREDPQNPAFKVPEKLDDAGQPVSKRGYSGMTVASGLWSALSDQQKSSFQTMFKPLTDTFNEETSRTGVKVNNLATRVKEFKQQLPAQAKKELDLIFQHAAASNTRAGNHAASPSSSKQQDVEEADQSSSPDPPSASDSDDKQQQAQQKEQESKKLHQAKEKKKHDKEEKEGKKEKKKENKAKEGKKGEEGSSKKKKKTVDSDDE